MGESLTWMELCQDYCGHWVALDEVRYDAGARPLQGVLVDFDEDVVELCNRVREAQKRECAILFVELHKGLKH
jgi:hypothetical protein